MVYRFGWFSTGRDPAARELLKVVYDSCSSGFIPGEIAYVFCSREKGEKPESDAFIAMAENYGLPVVCFSSKNFKVELSKEGKSDPAKLEQWRTEYDTEVHKLLANFKFESVVLAGYMLIVSPMLCSEYDMVNLHPAKPDGPKGSWQEVIWELINTGAEDTGVMMHLVTEELDRGPPITYCSFPIRGGSFEPLYADLETKLKDDKLAMIEAKEGEAEPYFAMVREEGVKRELPLIIMTIRSLASGTVKIKDKKIYAGAEQVKGGYDLTKEIEAYISSKND